MPEHDWPSPQLSEQLSFASVVHVFVNGPPFDEPPQAATKITTIANRPMRSSYQSDRPTRLRAVKQCSPPTSKSRHVLGRSS